MKSVLVLTPFGYCRLCEFGLIIKPLCTRTDLGCKEPSLCKKIQNCDYKIIYKTWKGHAYSSKVPWNLSFMVNSLCRKLASVSLHLFIHLLKGIKLKYTVNRASLVSQLVKNPLAIQETSVWSLDQKDPLEKEMVTHLSILAWKIPWTEVPGRLQSMGSQESDMT